MAVVALPPMLVVVLVVVPALGRRQAVLGPPPVVVLVVPAPRPPAVRREGRRRAILAGWAGWRRAVAVAAPAGRWAAGLPGRAGQPGKLSWVELSYSILQGGGGEAGG